MHGRQDGTVNCGLNQRTTDDIIIDEERGHEHEQSTHHFVIINHYFMMRVDTMKMYPPLARSLDLSFGQEDSCTRNGRVELLVVKLFKYYGGIA